MTVMTYVLTPPTLRGGPLEKWLGGGGVEKAKKKFAQGKNKEKKFVHQETLKTKIRA